MAAQSPEVAASPEFRLPFREGIVRVVPLKRPSTSAQFKELAMLVRSMSMLRWVFTLSAAPGTLVLRGLPGQLASDLEEVAKAIRTRTEVRNLYLYTPLRALAFRSIPSAAKAAEQLIAERYQ